MYKYFNELVDFVGSRPKPFDNTKKYISTGALKTNKISEDDIEIIEYANRPSRADLEVKTGDILFAKMAFTDKRLLIGEIEANYIYSTGFFAVKPKEGIITSKCLYYLLNSESFKNQKDINSTGATQKAITIEGLKKINLRIPEYHRQNQIGKTIENIDKIIKLREQQLTEYDQLIKSRFVEMFGDQVKNPFRWSIKTIGETCKLKSGNTLPLDLENEGGAIPYIKVGDMNMIGNEKYITNSSRFVSLKTAGKGIFDVGTVIFPKRGGAIGTNKKRMTISPICADLNVMGVTPLEVINSHYLLAYFDEIDLGSLNNGSSVPQINNIDIAPLKICVPPIELQYEFSDFVQQVDKLKFAVQKSLDETQTLFDSLMQKYFG